MTDAKEIRVMKLYQNFERLENEINELKKTKKTDIQPKDLFIYDTMHYHGVKSVEAMVEPCVADLKKNGVKDFTVIDVGSGLGGPARYLAERFSCKVTAVELQKEANDYAQQVTDMVKSKVDLKSLITHVEGDFVTLAKKKQIGSDFDIMTSFLTFLHINDKEGLFEECRALMKNDGYLVIEDYYKKSDDVAFTKEEQNVLKNEVFCNSSTLPTKAEYISLLEAAGFGDVKFVDMTENWSAFVKSRFEAYKASKERQLKVHGLQTFESQVAFYGHVNKLFQNGNGKTATVGGARIVCKAV